MSRTIRKDRNDVKYLEGRDGLHLRTYKCKCNYCRGIRRNKLQIKFISKWMKDVINNL